MFFLDTTSRVWHTTGANTGFGLELALKAIKDGDRVIAAVRTPYKVPDSLKADCGAGGARDFLKLYWQAVGESRRGCGEDVGVCC